MLTRAVDVWISSSMRSLSVRGSKGEAVGRGEPRRILMVKTEEESDDREKLNVQHVSEVA